MAAPIHLGIKYKRPTHVSFLGPTGPRNLSNHIDKQARTRETDLVKGTVPRFFHEFFRKFAEIFAAQDAPPVSLIQVANGKIFKLKNSNYFVCHHTFG
jgi:hypothetical protein